MNFDFFEKEYDLKFILRLSQVIEQTIDSMAYYVESRLS